MASTPSNNHVPRGNDDELPLTFVKKEPHLVTDPHIAVCLALHGVQPDGIRLLLDNRVAFEYNRKTHLFTQVLDSHNRGTLTASTKLYALLYRDFVEQIRLLRSNALRAAQQDASQGVSNECR